MNTFDASLSDVLFLCCHAFKKLSEIKRPSNDGTKRNLGSSRKDIRVFHAPRAVIDISRKMSACTKLVSPMGLYASVRQRCPFKMIRDER